MRLAVWRCFLCWVLSSTRIWSMMPSQGPSLGRATGFFRWYPGGSENCSILRIVLRDRPNSRAACRTLMPSTCTARLTRAYTSTLYTSQVSHKTQSPCHVLELKYGGLLFDRHKTPLTRRFVVYYCSAVYSRLPSSKNTCWHAG